MRTNDIADQSMKVQFGNPNATTSLEEAISRYPKDEFASATRSTIPLLSLLLRQPDYFIDLLRPLGLPPNYEMFLEYTVKSPQGRGRASHTDLMLIAERFGLALEAKWTEPMYELTQKWINGGKDETNRQLVLDGWLSLLKRPAGRELDRRDFLDVVYQMIHRAASVASVSDLPRLAYFVFKPSPDQRSASTLEVKSQLGKLWRKLGCPSQFPFYVVEIEIEPTSAFEPLRHLPKGESSTSDAVISALLDSTPLFYFRNANTHVISGDSDGDQAS